MYICTKDFFEHTFHSWRVQMRCNEAKSKRYNNIYRNNMSQAIMLLSVILFILSKSSILTAAAVYTHTHTYIFFSSLSLSHSLSLSLFLSLCVCTCVYTYTNRVHMAN